eukprot:gene7998-10818_t
MSTAVPIEDFLLKTQRGNDKIEFGGRLFRLDCQTAKLNSDGTKSYYYKCCTSKCKGRLIGYCSVDEHEISNYKHDENSHSNILCRRDENAIMVEKARKKCSSLVTSGAKRGYSAAMGTVVGELVGKIGIEAAAQFPCASTGKRAVHRDMQKILGHPPSAFSGLNSIPEQFGFTKAQQRFLLVFESFIDDNAVDCGPIIIFATKSDLQKLFAATLIAVDGTFKIKPKPYAVVRGAQVPTINTFFGVAHSRRLYRRVLAIMPRKTK